MAFGAGPSGYQAVRSEVGRSLLSYAGGTPMLPAGHLFTNLPSSHIYCWSSTTSPSTTTSAYRINLFNGPVQAITKTTLFYVLPVRGAPEP